MRQNVKFFRVKLIYLTLVLIFLGYISPIAAAQKKITSPQEFFGFQLGSDKKRARWDKIVEYFMLLENECDRLFTLEPNPRNVWGR